MKIIGGKEIGGSFTPKPPTKGRCPFKPLVVGGRGESQRLKTRLRWGFGKLRGK